MRDEAISADPASEADILIERQHLHQALDDAGLIEDVGSDAGLVFPIPAGAAIVRILRGYDTRTTTRQKVRCAACKQHQAHHRGFRVELNGGREARIGVNCGEAHFGAGAWQHAVTDFDRRAQLVQYRARVAPAVEAIHRIMPLVKAWHGRTIAYSRWIANFERDVPALFRQLSMAARVRDGRLERERRIRRGWINREGREEQHMVAETEMLAQIPFPAMFMRATPNHGLNGSSSELVGALALLTARSDAVGLARAFAHIRRARQHIQDADRVHRSILTNLGWDWLAGAVIWANQHDDLPATYRAVGFGIAHDEFRVDDRFDLMTQDMLGDPLTAVIDEIWP